ncbi:polyprotein [Elysia marginata]|uniref:Polyprotein n=1 Tax=Elysia marginata TaxID=1093978 RepID=A0AAV4HRZ2_9GAST|nr:polyprotein [Elysia marginata]
MIICVLSSCKIALSQGRCTWRHNRVPQELTSVISIAKEQFNPPSPSFTVFTTEGGAKTWCGMSNTAKKGSWTAVMIWKFQQIFQNEINIPTSSGEPHQGPTL